MSRTWNLIQITGWPLLVVLLTNPPASAAPATASTELQVSRLVSPYSMSHNLREKREEIISLIVNAATKELQATCAAQNKRLLDESHIRLCEPNYCPDIEMVVKKSSQTLSLEAFIESNMDFQDVRFGFNLVWRFGQDDGRFSVCYAPSLHPSILDLKQSLRTDPFFVNRVSSMQ